MYTNKIYILVRLTSALSKAQLQKCSVCLELILFKHNKMSNNCSKHTYIHKYV